MAKEIVEANWDEMKAMATSASLNARHRLFTETLVEMLESNDSIESFSVSDFVELILLAIPRYSDKQSRSLLLNGIKSVYRAHASAGEKNEKLIAAALIKMLLSQLYAIVIEYYIIIII